MRPIARPTGSVQTICSVISFQPAGARAGDYFEFIPAADDRLEVAERFAELMEQGRAVEIAGWDDAGDAIVCSIRLSEVDRLGAHIAGTLIRDIMRTPIRR